MAKPFLQCHHRFKNGKDHCYWSIAETVRTPRGWVQRHRLYLGEINASQKAAGSKTGVVFDTTRQQTQELALYPAARAIPEHAADYGVPVRLREFELRRPRQWGDCWVGCPLWDQLQLAAFWKERLPDSRAGTCWRHVLQTLTLYRLIDPGSEWRLHREGFKHSARADLLEEDFSLAQKDNLYRCWDKVLAPRAPRFQHLRQRWEYLFGVKCEVLLQELTRTYFESAPPFPEGDKRRYGYRRDKRSDCVQVVIALVGTPEGFPLAYEVMAGNTADRTTLRGFLDRIEKLHGKAERIWVMARGIPTEEGLEQRRQSDPPIHYLVGTPKGRPRYEQELRDRPWQGVREGVQVKLLPQDKELYVLAQSNARGNKEPAMRRRAGRYLWRGNLSGKEPARLWPLYIQLTQVAAAFKDLKGDLSLRPIYHQLEQRIEAHLFVAFPADGLPVSLRARLRVLAPGLTPRSMLEKFAAIQMLDVHFPTTDGRERVFCRYPQPEKDHPRLLAQLGWERPPQSPPRITQKGERLKA